MKKITLLFIFFFALTSYAQTKGITYQAVLLNPAGNQTRGVGQNLPLIDKQICMSFKFVDEFANVEYQEVVQTKTDSYGMVNLIIGSGEQTGGYASTFSDISWSTLNKKLVVGANTNGSCNTFIEISNQDFSFVPFAHAATNAENVTGVVAIENGGTNATTIVQAKTNLQLQNVNNTADADKPISTATQAALGLKVDKEAGKGLSTNDYSTAEKTKLAAISGTNTGDQDLSGFATTTNLGLKVDKEIGKGLSTEDYSTAEKTKLAAISGTNTGDQDLSGFVTTTNLGLKVDKEAGKGLSTNDYSTAEKTKLAAISGTNTGDQDLSGFATTTNLGLKANIDSPTFTGSPVAPTAIPLTSSTQIATTEFVTDAIATSSSKFLPLTGGTLSGGILGTTAEFNSNVKVSSLTLSGSRIWELAPFGTGVTLVQGGCCRRFTIDEEGRFAIGANYDPSFQLDVQGDGRFTSDVTATAFKILNGTASQFLKADGSVDTSTYLTSTAASNFVALTGDQSINGDKRFANNILVRGTSLGAFGGADTGNIGFGIANYVYGDTSTMYNNTAIGNFAFTSSSGSNNTAIGTNAIRQGDGGSGDENTAVGTAALTNAQAGNRNTAVGAFTMTQAVGSENTAIGNQAGMNIRTGSYNTFLGSGTGINLEENGSINNTTAIGNGAKVAWSNTIQLGNSAITDVVTSGKITTGAITIPNVDGDAGQVLSTDGLGIVSWITPSTASSSTFVDLISNQNIGGVKNFSNDIKINGLLIGKGTGNGDQNLAVGTSLGTGTGYRNTGIGVAALNSFSGTSFGNNTGVGYFSMVGLTTGYGNTSIGAETMFNVGSHDNNTAIGNQSLINAESSDNTATGANAGSNVTTGGGNTFIGRAANVSNGTFYNSTAIGREAIATASNTIQLGNNTITNVNTSGTITAGTVSYPNAHNNTSGQVLTTNVSGLASWQNSIQYKQVILSSNTNDQTPVTVGGISIRVNNKILEIARVTNTDPSTIGVYATVYKSTAGAFNANTDGSGGPVTPKFGTTIANANVGTWSSLLDSANGVTQEVGDYYFKLEADLSVYNSSKTYKLTVLIDGWGKVIMRLIYYAE